MTPGLRRGGAGGCARPGAAPPPAGAAQPDAGRDRPDDGRAQMPLGESGRGATTSSTTTAISPRWSARPERCGGARRARLTSPAASTYPPTRHHSGSAGVQRSGRSPSIPRSTSTSPAPSDAAVVRVGHHRLRPGRAGRRRVRGPAQGRRPANGTRPSAPSRRSRRCPSSTPGRRRGRRGERALEGDPAVVNRDPYGDGWMVKLRVAEPGDLTG